MPSRGLSQTFQRGHRGKMHPLCQAAGGPICARGGYPASREEANRVCFPRNRDPAAVHRFVLKAGPLYRPIRQDVLLSVSLARQLQGIVIF